MNVKYSSFAFEKKHEIMLSLWMKSVGVILVLTFPVWVYCWPDQPWLEGMNNTGKFPVLMVVNFILHLFGVCYLLSRKDQLGTGKVLFTVFSLCLMAGGFYLVLVHGGLYITIASALYLTGITCYLLMLLVTVFSPVTNNEGKHYISEGSSIIFIAVLLIALILLATSSGWLDQGFSQGVF